jgi:uncharacterized ferritin-like protein (DUF455 family)
LTPHHGVDGGSYVDASCTILEIILRNEITHVAAGTRWFRHLCAEHALDPIQTFRHIVATHGLSAGRGPLNHVARHAVGFMPEELSDC